MTLFFNIYLYTAALFLDCFDYLYISKIYFLYNIDTMDIITSIILKSFKVVLIYKSPLMSFLLWALLR